MFPFIAVFVFVVFLSCLCCCCSDHFCCITPLYWWAQQSLHMKNSVKGWR